MHEERERAAQGEREGARGERERAEGSECESSCGAWALLVMGRWVSAARAVQLTFIGGYQLETSVGRVSGR